MKRLALLAMIACSLSICSCGQLIGGPQVGSDPRGVIYYLPRTEFRVQYSITDGVVKANVQRALVPDHRHPYYLTLCPGLFSSDVFSIQLTDTGMLSSVSSQTTEQVVDSVKSLASFAFTLASPVGGAAGAAAAAAADATGNDPGSPSTMMATAKDLTDKPVMLASADPNKGVISKQTQKECADIKCPEAGAPRCRDNDNCDPKKFQSKLDELLEALREGHDADRIKKAMNKLICNFQCAKAILQEHGKTLDKLNIEIPTRIELARNQLRQIVDVLNQKEDCSKNNQTSQKDQGRTIKPIDLSCFKSLTGLNAIPSGAEELEAIKVIEKIYRILCELDTKACDYSKLTQNSYIKENWYDAFDRLANYYKDLVEIVDKSQIVKTQKYNLKLQLNSLKYTLQTAALNIQALWDFKAKKDAICNPCQIINAYSLALYDSDKTQKIIGLYLKHSASLRNLLMLALTSSSEVDETLSKEIIQHFWNMEHAFSDAGMHLTIIDGKLQDMFFDLTPAYADVVRKKLYALSESNDENSLPDYAKPGFLHCLFAENKRNITCTKGRKEDSFSDILFKPFSDQKDIVKLPYYSECESYPSVPHNFKSILDTLDFYLYNLMVAQTSGKISKVKTLGVALAAINYRLQIMSNPWDLKIDFWKKTAIIPSNLVEKDKDIESKDDNVYDLVLSHYSRWTRNIIDEFQIRQLENHRQVQDFKKRRNHFALNENRLSNAWFVISQTKLLSAFLENTIDPKIMETRKTAQEELATLRTKLSNEYLDPPKASASVARNSAPRVFWLKPWAEVPPHLKNIGIPNQVFVLVRPKVGKREERNGK